MACTQTLSNITRQCEDKKNKGGLHTTVWLANHDEVKVTFANGDISAIDPVGSSISWVKFEFAKGGATFETESSFDGETGDYQFSTNNLTINLRKQNAAKRTALNAVLESETFAIVRDANGVYYAMGTEEYVSVTAASATTGTARTDTNQMSVTLTDTTSGFCPQVSEQIITSLNLPA